MTASPGVNPPPAYPETPTATGPRRLLRSRTNRMFAGVCGGLAEAYGADATAVRLLTVIFGVITGIFPVLIIYLIAAIVIPDRDAGDVPVGMRALRSSSPAGRAGSSRASPWSGSASLRLPTRGSTWTGRFSGRSR